jgi:adenylyl-sulfate kinase
MSDNYYQKYDINQSDREKQKSQKGLCIWFTGLSGSGKSTIANALEKKLFQEGRHSYVLDGDNIRTGLSSDLGFLESDRVENIRRVSEVAKLMVDAGLITIVTLISPFNKDREIARNKFNPNQFIEVYLSTPLEECEFRDVKGLYKKAREGTIKNFTGVTSPYEIPLNPDLVMNTKEIELNEAIQILEEYILDLQILWP